MPASRRSEFGDFLRSRREKLSPASGRLGSGRRRRTPGLRREEVAELAGIGVDWYVRLEQGRTVSPSDATLDALARALRLGKAEATHLRALARSNDQRTFAAEKVPPAIARIVSDLGLPAYVTGSRWDILAWNRAEADRNILVFMFIDPEARRLFGPAWEDEARRMIALFRATHDLLATDPSFVQLVERLRSSSAEFASWWIAHDVRGGASGEKVLAHPQRGIQRYQYATFQANDDPSLKLSIYTPI
ncbi:helix-turn-helix transcriptional regulator [Paraburkholderia youngii]|uniref:Helix-turn-helix domain-containing protein n=1 Tax=Paraburkholderia youngii TaxID=2782701 RepID=A0ABX2NJJ0_9BURK|nr:helix-turn-helix transcriptional regulator [Paraburkholderia youngii]NVI04581.1 helix-turn-helix domain-containing protein [Paraburkholderia youngii]